MSKKIDLLSSIPEINKKNINVQRIVAIILLVAMIAMYLSSLFMYK